MNDPYVYPGTEVLINKLNIRDKENLDSAENELTVARLAMINENNPIKGNYDYQHLKAYHKYIFQDIYDWAGEQRTVDIEKSELVLNGIMFKHTSLNCIEKEIIESLNKLNSIEWKCISLDKKVENFSIALADVWKAHAFREGNTRTTITFFNKYAEEHGFHLDEKLISDNIKYVRNSLVAASYEDEELGIRKNFSYLNRIIKDSIESYAKKNINRKTLDNIRQDIDVYNNKSENNIKRNIEKPKEK